MDIVKFEGKFVVGYKARFALDKDLREGHSYDGYSLETFPTLEEAKKYLEDYFPQESVCILERRHFF